MPSCIRTYSPFFDPNVNKYDHRNAWKRQILGNQVSKWEDRKISGTVFCESGTLFRDLKNGMIGFGHFRLCLPEYALFEQPSLPGRYCQGGSKRRISRRRTRSPGRAFPETWHGTMAGLIRFGIGFPSFYSPLQEFSYRFRNFFQLRPGQKILCRARIFSRL